MNKKKMNIFYKLAFAAFCVCVVVLAGTLISFLYLKNTKLSLALGISGVVLSLLGIIFCMVSKPKKERELQENTEEAADLENIIDKGADA